MNIYKLNAQTICKTTILINNENKSNQIKPPQRPPPSLSLTM